jgi:homoserine dehydrogenase
MKEIGVGILGFGTVGTGVVEGLIKNSRLIAERIGVKPVLRKVADIDLKTDRGIRINKSILTSDAESLINDPSIDIVVELIGGTKIARKFILQALSRGKPVVTANKALLAEHGAEIFAAAVANNTEVCFEASVGGGIPIVRALRAGLVANHIDSMYGILNGTCNAILTRMDEDGMSFDDALRQAQAAGYAEADPALDIDGIDTAHKAALLASLAYGFHVPMKQIRIEGIRGIAQTDIENARSLGYRVKLLAVIKNHPTGIEIRVHPTLIPISHMLGSVNGVFNAIMVEGDVVGQTVYYGRGAGRYPTASAVISDIADLAGKLAAGGTDNRPPALAWQKKPCKFMETGQANVRYYLRISIPDKAGTLARVATILGRHHLSIASVIQQEKHAVCGKHVTVIIVTHEGHEANFQAALHDVNKMGIVGHKTVSMRIEDLGVARS